MNEIIKKIENYIKKHYFTIDAKHAFALSDSIVDFRKKVSKSFSETLLNIIDSKNLVDVEVYKKANIDRRHFSKMRNPSYHPRKSTVIKLIFALELTINQANKLLETAGYTLSNSVLTDVIVMYFLDYKEYDILKLNNVLKHYNENYI